MKKYWSYFSSIETTTCVYSTIFKKVHEAVVMIVQLVVCLTCMHEPILILKSHVALELASDHWIQSKE